MPLDRVRPEPLDKVDESLNVLGQILRVTGLINDPERSLRFNPGRPNGPVGQTPAAVWPALTPRNRYALAGFNATTAGFSSC